MQTILLLNESQSINAIDKKIVRDCGYEQILPMTSGSEAARFLAGDPLAATTYIAVVGMRLSDMTGEQFATILKSHPRLYALPILLLVPSETEKDQLQMLGTHAHALLARPIAVESMRASLALLATNPPKTTPAKGASDNLFFALLENSQTLVKASRYEPEAFYKVGMQCVQQKKWNSAIIAFTHALESPTLKGEAELGMAAAYTGKKDQNNVGYWLSQAAETMVNAGRWNIARTIFARVVIGNSQARNPFFVKARKHINQGHYAEAADTLAESLETVPAPLVGEKMADMCRMAKHPQTMLHTLLAALAKRTNLPPTLYAQITQSLKENFARKIEEARDHENQARLQRKEDLKLRLLSQNKENPAEDKDGLKPARGIAVREDPPETDPLGLLALPGDTPSSTTPVHRTEPFVPIPITPLSDHRSSLFGDIIQIIKMTWHLMRNSP
ncbi:MAG: histidine kinase [Desulfovibrio sp.]|nr:histidine kinase [Desulfovibrio sp.]